MPYRCIDDVEVTGTPVLAQQIEHGLRVGASARSWAVEQSGGQQIQRVGRIIGVLESTRAERGLEHDRRRQILDRHHAGGRPWSSQHRVGPSLQLIRQWTHPAELPPHIALGRTKLDLMTAGAGDEDLPAREVGLLDAVHRHVGRHDKRRVGVIGEQRGLPDLIDRAGNEHVPARSNDYRPWCGEQFPAQLRHVALARRQPQPTELDVFGPDARGSAGRQAHGQQRAVAVLGLRGPADPRAGGECRDPVSRGRSHSERQPLHHQRLGSRVHDQQPARPSCAQAVPEIDTE